MAQYLPILMMVVLVILFVLLSFIASIFLGVKRPTKAKTAHAQQTARRRHPTPRRRGA